MMPRLRVTLFWRVFISIWMAMAITLVAGNMATHALQDRERAAIERQAGLRDVAMQALAFRRDDDGGSLWRYLKSEGQRLDLHLRLIEVDQNDEELPQVIRERLESSGWYSLRPAVIPVADDYQLVAWPRKGAEGWVDARLYRWMEVLLAFVIITLACWWVARRVARPLKHMESTAREIAGGHIDLRVSRKIASRRDEIGAMATAFNGMTERLCYLLERQKHLMRDISHDLRTPLARQRVAIELASDASADDEMMASILRQNERLDAMTTQILTLYSVSEQGGDIQREPVQLLHVLNRVLADAADYAEHRGIDCRLTVMPDSERTLVLGDPNLLQRAFDNVLQNALDHTPPGNPVSLGLKTVGQRLVVDITDEGPGVPSSALGHLFEPFYRADKSRGGKGWGLGLAIARDILGLHDGEIEAFNGDRTGLVVRLSLPVFTRNV
ncbi:sensor histidine kinase [Marinobacter confluentis]|uniref:histidine kinase n=1 Tax=Marinobacter confluentis TaxID=1697557 RepID=A0A4Z1BRB6_9GAMM|nr:sensor histidine kinase [Marinobacter confluentis]TGN40145.1 sensor histidine kinase [Marinobacter confluentis]